MIEFLIFVALCFVCEALNNIRKELSEITSKLTDIKWKL